MIDFHCHLLPGIDDGPEAVEEALRMARALAVAGYSAVCCTPLFAHPERYDTFASAVTGTGLFERFQGNLGSLLGAYGDAVRRRSEQFLRQGIYSCLGTDGHSFESLQRTLAGARGLGSSSPAVRSLLATPLA